MSYEIAGAARLIGTAESNSPEWHKQRDTRIGGSEIAVIMRCSPYQSRFSLYHTKLGSVPRAELNKPMEWGNRLEPVVIRAHLDNHPQLRGYPATYGDTYVNVRQPWMLAHADALYFNGSGRLVLGMEAKTGQRSSIKTPWQQEGWGPSGSTDPADMPYHYYLQILWYMIVYGLDHWDVAVLLGGNDDRYYRMPYNERLAAQVISEAKLFLEQVRNRVQPDVDADTSTYQTLKELNPNVNDKESVEVSLMLATNYVAATRTAKTAEETRQKYTNLVMLQMGNAQYARDPNGNIIARRECRFGGKPYLKSVTPKDEGTQSE